MKALAEYLQATPLADGQKVLALTYMHGSRRRLQGQLESINGLAGRFECVVLDSIARRIVLRWQALLAQKGFEVPVVGDFNRICDAASLLLQEEIVGRWMAATYPVLILDEAQDLDGSRLGIIQGLSASINVIAAADEFQCLDDKLRPNIAFEWLEKSTKVEWLTTCSRFAVRRTRRNQKYIQSLKFGQGWHRWGCSNTKTATVRGSERFLTYSLLGALVSDGLRSKIHTAVIKISRRCSA
jgi:hypothetical protein